MPINTLSDLFVRSLRDTYSAENQGADGIRRMMQNQMDIALFDTLEHHLEETLEQIDRLEQVFRAIGHEPNDANCQAMRGIIEEAEEVAGNIVDENIRDVAAVASVLAIEQYEIARYGSLISIAERLGNTIVVDQSQLGSLDIVDLLQLSFDEETHQASRVRALADSRVNRSVQIAA